RMGVMSPNDWTIQETLPEYDAILKRTLRDKGDFFFRYNFDGYGERNDGQDYDNRFGRGRLWPIFTAERGIYEISRASAAQTGAPSLGMLQAAPTPAGLLSEQVWNESTNVTGWETDTPPPYEPGTATRSMRPLNWAMGEYINLVAAIRAGKNDA